MKFKGIALSLLGLLTLSACGRPEPVAPPVSTQNVDINLPLEDIDPADLTEVLNTADAAVIEGKQDIDILELTSEIDVTGDFKAVFDELIASRDPVATLECKNRKCKVTSTGKEFQFKPEGISIPVLGTPTIIITKKVDIYFELSTDKNKLEVCRIDGLKVKAGLFTQNVEGALLEVERAPDAQISLRDVGKEEEEVPAPVLPGDVIAIKTLKIDAGVGGSYPTRSCM